MLTYNNNKLHMYPILEVILESDCNLTVVHLLSVCHVPGACADPSEYSGILYFLKRHM